MSNDGIMNGSRDPHGYGIEVPPTTVIPTPRGTFVIGHVERIHGEGGRPCPEYIPTRHELEVLARYWAKVKQEHVLFFEVEGQTGSAEIREIMYAQDRLAAAAAHLGSETVAKIEREIRKELTAGLEPGSVLHLHEQVREQALEAGRVWARDPANHADLQRFAAAVAAADIHGPEQLWLELVSGTFTEREWLFGICAVGNPQRVTDDFDEVEQYAVNFASGVMTVWDKTNPNPRDQ